MATGSVNKKNGLTRRDFIKLGLAVGGTSALATAPAPRAAMAAAELPAHDTVIGYCPFCQTRCTFSAVREGGKARYLVGREGNQWTGGGMCPKGMSLLELVDSPHRLTKPMLKVDGVWQDISYAAAVELVAEKLNASKAQHGKDVAKRLALTSPLWDCRESELAALMTMRFAGGVNVMPPGEVCISTASSSLNNLLGSGNSTTTVDQLANADLLVLWGANISETYPPYTRWLEQAAANGTKVVYLDCRKTRTSNFATRQFRIRPGTDGALALGCIHWLIENGHYDADYVAANTKNFEMLQKDAAAWPDYASVATATGLSQKDVAEFYRLIAASKRSMVWMGGSLSRYTNGMATIRAIVAIQVIRNQIMGEGQGLLTMESGKPEGEKEFVDHICGKAPSGVNFRRLIMALNKGDIDVFFLNSSYRRYPDCNGLKEALSKAGFVVYRGFFPTEELDVADLFLPATFTLESQGSHYGAEKQVVWRDKCQDAPGECKADWEFYRDVGRKIAPDRYPAFESPEELATLFSATVPGWGGITVERLRESPGGLIGPIDVPGGPQQLGCIFPDGKFRTEDGNFDFLLKAAGSIVWTPPKGAPGTKDSPTGADGAPQFPLTFIQGKVVTQWQQTMTNFAASLAQFSNGRYVQVHPETAAQCGVSHGQTVMLATEFGEIEARAEVTEAITPGVVFTPSHFTGTSPFEATRSAPVNTILPNYWDRISAQFNGLGCTLRPLGRPLGHSGAAAAEQGA